MIDNTSLKPDLRHATRRLTAIFARLPLTVVVACVVAGFAHYALGLRKQGHAETASDKPAITRTLVATEGVEHLDRLAREPMIVELSDGTLFVTGYGGQFDEVEKIPDLWRSRDHGATWEHVNVGRNADGAIGNSDVDLAVGPDNTLYFVAMSYDNKKFEGTRIAVGVSKDAGATWTWKVLSETRFDDRPWIGVTPDGTAHAIWNDGNGVRYEVGHDRGASWKERPRINDQGGSSHLAIGPHGEIAVRITPASASYNKFTPGVDLIAVSRDGGNTWQKHPAPGERDWSPALDKRTPRWVEPVAWDADGALYSLWGSQKGLWLARSLDRGEAWTTWHIVSRDEVSYFPYLIASGHGELAATWSSGDGDALLAHVAVIHLGDGRAPPQVIEAQPFQTDIWSKDHPGDPMQRETAGEYIPVLFLRAGGLGVVTAIQSDAEAEERVARKRAGIATTPTNPNLRQRRLGFKWWKFAER
jgi:hypothetical protein